MKALEKMVSIVCESTVREKTYSKVYENETGRKKQKQDMETHFNYQNKIKGLYKKILKFQATSYTGRPL